jgi:hypothetical protein
MKEYKVISTLCNYDNQVKSTEETINSLAKQGWKVISSSCRGTSNDLVIILERDR